MAEWSVSLLVDNGIHSGVEGRALVDKDTSERELNSSERSTGCSRSIDRFAVQSRRTDREEREGNQSFGISSIVLRWEAISTADERIGSNASVSTDRMSRLCSTSVAREKHSFVNERYSSLDRPVSLFDCWSKWSGKEAMNVRAEFSSVRMCRSDSREWSPVHLKRSKVRSTRVLPEVLTDE